MMKMSKTISIQSFLGFVIACVVTLLTNDVLITALIYCCGYAVLTILGIDKPGLGKFVVELFRILNDSKTTIDEKIAAIRDAVQKLVGLWVDLDTLKAKSEPKEEKKDAIMDGIELLE